MPLLAFAEKPSAGAIRLLGRSVSPAKTRLFYPHDATKAQHILATKSKPHRRCKDHHRADQHTIPRPTRRPAPVTVAAPRAVPYCLHNPESGAPNRHRGRALLPTPRPKACTVSTFRRKTCPARQSPVGTQRFPPMLDRILPGGYMRGEWWGAWVYTQHSGSVSHIPSIVYFTKHHISLPLLSRFIFAVGGFHDPAARIFDCISAFHNGFNLRPLPCPAAVSPKLSCVPQPDRLFSVVSGPDNCGLRSCACWVGLGNGRKIGIVVRHGNTLAAFSLAAPIHTGCG